MTDMNINVPAVLAAAVASFVASAVWYAVFGGAVERLQQQWRGTTASNQSMVRDMVVIFASSLIIALAVAFLIGLTDVSGVAQSAGLGLLLWVGFAMTQWMNSIVGEDVPVLLAAIHAGDWLLHTVIISVIIGIWR